LAATVARRGLAGRLRRGWRKVILVTSALHIPRSVAVFAAQGIAVVPVVCDFQAYGSEKLKS